MKAATTIEVVLEGPHGLRRTYSELDGVRIINAAQFASVCAAHDNMYAPEKLRALFPFGRGLCIEFMGGGIVWFTAQVPRVSLRDMPMDIGTYFGCLVSSGGQETMNLRIGHLDLRLHIRSI